MFNLAMQLLAKKTLNSFEEVEEEIWISLPRFHVTYLPFHIINVCIHEISFRNTVYIRHKTGYE